MQNSEIFNIHKRIYQFVLDVLNFIALLPHTPLNLIFINQISRCVTSIGANDQEADGANSSKDFVAKYSIVRKEAKETRYWLRLIGDLNPQYKKQIGVLLDENEAIIKIVSSIIGKTMKNH